MHLSHFSVLLLLSVTAGWPVPSALAQDRPATNPTKTRFCSRAAQSALSIYVQTQFSMELFLPARKRNRRVLTRMPT